MATAKKAPWKNYLHTAITLALMLFVRFIPPMGPITEFGWTIIGIFVGTIYGWITCNTIWPSFAAVLFMGISTTVYPNVSKVMVACGTNTSVLTCLTTISFVSIVSLTGAGEWLGRWLISRPFLKGRPMLLISFLMLTSFVISPFTGMATFLLLWEIILVLNDQLGFEKKSRFSQLLIFSILFNYQQTIWLLHQQHVITPTGLFTAFIEGFAFEAWPFIPFGIVLSLCLIFANIFMLKFFFKMDVSVLKSDKVDIREPEPINKRQKAALILVIIYVILQVIPSFLPKALPIAQFINRFGVMGYSLTLLVVALIMKIDGKPFVTWNDIQKKVAWNVVLLPATANILAGALTSDDTGVKLLLSNLLSPMFSNLSPYFFMLIMAVMMMVLTNFINNIVVIALFLPIIFSVGPAIGVNVAAMLPMVVFSTYAAFMLPSANPMAAVMHSRSDIIDTKEIVKFSMVTMLACALVYAVVGIPLALVLFPA